MRTLRLSVDGSLLVFFLGNCNNPSVAFQLQSVGRRDVTQLIVLTPVLSCDLWSFRYWRIARQARHLSSRELYCKITSNFISLTHRNCNVSGLTFRKSVNTHTTDPIYTQVEWRVGRRSLTNVDLPTYSCNVPGHCLYFFGFLSFNEVLV